MPHSSDTSPEISVLVPELLQSEEPGPISVRTLPCSPPRKPVRVLPRTSNTGMAALAADFSDTAPHPRPCGRPSSQQRELPLPCWHRQSRKPPQDRSEQTRVPGYAPDLNPAEPLCGGTSRAAYLANRCA